MMYRRNAPRRYGNFKRRYSSSRSRLHTPIRPVRWQAANFNFISELIHTEQNDPQNLVIVLAQLPDRVGDQATAPGRTLQNLARNLELGGIVFDYHFTNNVTTQDDQSGQPWPFTYQTQFILATDRLDSDGNPAAIDTAWNTNTLPVTTAVATEVQDLDDKYPTRIHYRRSHLFDLAVQPAFDVTGDVRSGITTYSGSGRGNIRLRNRYSDEQALVVHVPSIAPRMNSSYVRVSTLFSFTGTLYYRVRF